MDPRALPAARVMDEFVQRFADWWADPDPDRLSTILADDVTLIQPIQPDTHGLDAAIAGMRGLFEFIPDLRGAVHDSARDGEIVFIHFTLSGTYGGKPISWRAVDRFVVREDGLASERTSWFDSAPLGLQLLTRPRGWPVSLRWMRSAFKR